MNSIERVDARFFERVKSARTARSRPMRHLTHDAAGQIFRSAMMSRHLDIEARQMQRLGTGFYSIGSSGHEAMAAVAAAVRYTDTAFLHYRDCAFQIERANQLPGQSALWDLLLSFTVSSEDPISGGRHKVLGSRSLNIPPQTSTIASHLPKALGYAYSIGLRSRMGAGELPRDSIAICSFGDASLNHSTAQGTINSAGWIARQGVPVPLLLICEDNGIGISVRSPHEWVSDNLRSRRDITYFTADSSDIDEAFLRASEAANFVRTKQRPAVLHLKTVRLFAHAGADVEDGYLTKNEINFNEQRDPVAAMAVRLIEAGAIEASEVVDAYRESEARVARVAAKAVLRPRLHSAEDIMAAIAPCSVSLEKKAVTVRKVVTAIASNQARQTMAQSINLALREIMQTHDDVFLFGEDVGRKGGVYGVTKRLQSEFGVERVFDTMLDEQTILGNAIGMSLNGFLPIPEIQFLAYLHNAIDQIRGEAATMSFFSNGQYSNPMVVRIPGLGYQRGFGGHFHNDNAIAALRDIPGVIVVSPSSAANAPRLLREAVRLARDERRIVVYLEPIALYHSRNLFDDDAEWTFAYSDSSDGATFGEVELLEGNSDLAIVSYANGFYLCAQAAKVIEERSGLRPHLIDIQWLSPLPIASLCDALAGYSKVLIIDECRRSGSPSEGIISQLHDRDFMQNRSVRRICSRDSFTATGPAYAAILPSLEQIVEAAIAMTDGTDAMTDGVDATMQSGQNL